ncbi:helix-turn-helix domain-containing protein [Paenibacillus dauci]|uniref:helix-turn-helix domain-containing protein n=1 Tax=Paenibacillus dauci TaxID=1567106 RepID=UPI00061A00CC|nr:helix-turn-helix transcriptional regulator [Paenibacillus dauci]
MVKQNDIRSIIEQEMKKKGYNLSQFSRFSGMNRGTLSLILNKNPAKLPSIPQIDKIAEALGYEQGWLYELYLEECFEREVPHWRRLKKFLYRCLQLNKQVLINRVLSWLIEDLDQTVAVFAAAEEWYYEGYRKELIPFYQYVVNNEKYLHAERLAISHYRIFCLSQGRNSENNLRAAIIFEPYRYKLPVGYKLDALMKIANVYYIQKIWGKVELFADELREVAKEVYKSRFYLNNVYDEPGLSTERHLVVYYGQGYVLKSNALAEQGKYEDALKYMNGYQNLSWFDGLDKDGEKEVLKLSHFAKANFFAVNVLKGNQEFFPKYVEFLRSNYNEVLPGLMTILTAANKHDFIIDHIINEFLTIIEMMKEDLQNSDKYYTNASNIDRFENLYRQLAIYHFRQANYSQGIEYMSKCLAIANQINKKSEFTEYPELLKVLKEWSLLMERNQKADPTD